jgi:hypothetical protein
MRTAVQWVTDCEKGGVLLPDGLDAKTGEQVIEVHQSKHPDTQILEASKLEDYKIAPNFVDLDITEELIKKVAQCLSGSVGPGGADTQAIQHWLLRFGQTSQGLGKAVCEFTDWMANDLLSWVAYRALKAERLVALDKCPGVRPVGIGESWGHLTAKCVLFVAVGEAKEECGMDQLCAGLEAGIEGGIHAMRLLWDMHLAEEEWGFLLVDAKNAFNEGNWRAMC